MVPKGPSSSFGNAMVGRSFSTSTATTVIAQSRRRIRPLRDELESHPATEPTATSCCRSCIQPRVATGTRVALWTSTVEEHMQNDQPRIHIELTDEQRKEIKDVAGHDISAVEFSAEELEQRIAPANITFVYGGLGITYTTQKPNGA